MLINIVFELPDNYLIEVWHKVINHDPSFLAKNLSLCLKAPFILNLDNLTCYPLNC